MTTPCFLAGIFRINEENSIRALIPSGSTVSQVVIYGGALLLVALGALIWAVAFRGLRHRRSSRHPSKSVPRRSRPAEGHTRFRTLAEAGGLPPVRSGQQPSPRA